MPEQFNRKVASCMVTQVVGQELNLAQFSCIFNQVHIFITATVKVFKCKTRNAAFCFADQVVHARIVHVVFPGWFCWFGILHQKGFKQSVGIVRIVLVIFADTTKISINIEGRKK